MMFKLIPEDKKRMLMREYVLRRGVIIIFSFIAVLIIALVGLLPSFLLSNLRNQTAHERISKIDAQPIDEEDLMIKEWHDGINRKLKYLSPNLDKDQPSSFIEGVLIEKSEGIKINGISYSNTNNKISLTLNGTAQNRQALIAFQNKLTQSGNYGEVSLPVSNLAKDKDISFQLKVTPPKKK